MAVERNASRTAPATSTAADRTAKKTLGFFNVNIETKAGAPVRLEGIRFIEGNKQHEQLAAYLSVSQACDADFAKTASVEGMAAEKARRLGVVASKLTFSFNATRTDEESMLDLV
jgi:ERCC4-type nuclease